MQDANNESFQKAFRAVSNNQFADGFQAISKTPAAEHLQFGHWLLQHSQPLQAARWFKYLLQIKFTEPLLNYWCGVCFSAASNSELAEFHLKLAIKQTPNSELAYIALAQLFQSQNNLSAAHQYLKTMLQLIPNNPQLWLQSGALLVESHAYSMAKDYFLEVVKKWPDQAMAHNDLASCYQHLGEFELSHKYYFNALKLDPNIAGAYLGLATCKKYRNQNDRSLPFLDKVKIRSSSVEVNACYHFAKAKIFDDLKLFDSAWQQLETANRICQQQQPKWSVTKWSSNIDNIIQNFETLETSPSADNNVNNTTPIPIFIIGMPRSGTTLLEKLISQFEGVSIAGELDGFDQILGFLNQQSSYPTNNPGLGLHYPQQLRQISAVQKQQFRQYYLQLLTAKTNSNSRWIVDKNPLNFIHLGLIQSLFPEALFIHNTRQPMDILLSNYFQFFAHANLAYSFNIETIANFIKNYQRLMAHWLTLSNSSSLQIIELNYLDVVSDTEHCLKQIQQFLGNPKLNNQSNQAIITTASLWQARQPIYSSSLERWKNYQKQLQCYSDCLQSWL